MTTFPSVQMYGSDFQYFYSLETHFLFLIIKPYHESGVPTLMFMAVIFLAL